MFDFVIIQWEKLNSLPEFGALIVAIVGVAFAVYYIFLRKKEQSDEDIIKNYQVSIDSYKERLEAVEAETKSCHDQHKETIKQLGELKGRLDIVEDIPLEKIAESMQQIQRESAEVLKTVADIVKTQREIIKLMDGGK